MGGGGKRGKEGIEGWEGEEGEGRGMGGGREEEGREEGGMEGGSWPLPLSPVECLDGFGGGRTKTICPEG